MSRTRACAKVLGWEPTACFFLGTAKSVRLRTKGELEAGPRELKRACGTECGSAGRGGTLWGSPAHCLA